MKLAEVIIPFSKNKLLAWITNTPHVHQRHRVFCSGWSYFSKIIWHRNDMRKINIKDFRYLLADFTNASIFVSGSHVVIWNSNFIDRCNYNKLSYIIWKRKKKYLRNRKNSKLNSHLKIVRYKEKNSKDAINTDTDFYGQ